MKNNLPDINNLINQVIDTLLFYGVTIKSMSLEHKVPEFNVCLSNNLKYDLQKTLDFTYWTLWTLVNPGENPETSTSKIILNYYQEPPKEVSSNEC